MANTFLGSIAHEDVLFTTETITTYTAGQNFMDLMVFIEKDRFVISDDSDAMILAYDKTSELADADQLLTTATSALNSAVLTAQGDLTPVNISAITTGIGAVDTNVTAVQQKLAAATAPVQAINDPTSTSLLASAAASILLVNSAKLALDTAAQDLANQMSSVQQIIETNDVARADYQDALDISAEINTFINQYVSQQITDLTAAASDAAILSQRASALSTAYGEVVTAATGTVYQVAAEEAQEAVDDYVGANSTGIVGYLVTVNAFIANPTTNPSDLVYTDFVAARDALVPLAAAASGKVTALNTALAGSFQAQLSIYNDAYLLFVTPLAQLDNEVIQLMRQITEVRAEHGSFIAFDENPDYKYAKVNINNFGNLTKGVLKQWLTDYFLSGHSNDVWLVVVGSDINDTASRAQFISNLAAVYDFAKVYAYWKTACVGEPLDPEVAVQLADLCALDKQLLSSAPMYPVTTSNPASIESDPIANAILTKGVDAWLTYHPDVTRNGCLVSLGDAMAVLNASGTPLGNNIDYHGLNYITASGRNGTNLAYGVREYLKDKKIAFFKSVDSISGNVAAIGATTVKGTFIQAQVIVCYINYMTKEDVAQYITGRNILRNAQTYAAILALLRNQLNRFLTRIERVVITAPSFENLPASSGDEIIIPNAWSGYYVNQLHRVQVQGTLYIAA
jgi:hypothetical protein